jgi:NitT/TauT family transport system substrate-binding protein
MPRGLRRLSAVALLLWASTVGALAQAPKTVAKGEVIRIQEYAGAIAQIVQWTVMDQGFCTTHGLKCEMVQIPSGPLGLQALAAGSLEIVLASTDVIMQAAARGNDVQLVVGHSPNNLYALLVRADVPLPHRAAGYPAVMQDIKGLRVGVTARGAATEIETRALLAGAGMNPDTDVTYVAVGSTATSYPTMVAKQIDAAMGFEPFQTLCKTQKTCVVGVDLSAGEGPPELRALNGGFETYAATRKYIETHPVAIQAFVEAMVEATAWVQQPQNFEAVLAVVRRHFSLGDIPNAEAVLIELVKAQLPSYGTRIDRNAVKAFSDFLLHYKLIEQPVAPASFVYPKAP